MHDLACTGPVLLLANPEMTEEAPVTVPWVPEPSAQWCDIVRPVTVFQIHQAEDSPFFNDKCFMIDGRGFGKVIVVAHVVSADVRAATCTYELEDGTGRIRATKILDSVAYNSSSEVEDAARCNALIGTFVEGHGSLRRFNGRMNLELDSIRPVVDFNQVLHHTLLVIHTSMLLDNHVSAYDPDSVCADYDAPTPAPAPVADPLLESPLSNGGSMSGPGPSHTPQDRRPSASVTPPPLRKRNQWASLAPLPRAILDYIHHVQHVGDRDRCIPVDEIFAAVEASQACSKEEFHLSIEELLADAYITSPLDDGCVVITPR
ncbi:hypothetical protein F5I97DRAFT_518786 [Phlebopus sp. FC_14]|nr:hypothetical protein F5I97DRAFT_518786 [Phlebopus sp. FC_14]